MSAGRIGADLPAAGDVWRSDLHRMGRRNERGGVELAEEPGRKERYSGAEAEAEEEADATLL